MAVVVNNQQTNDGSVDNRSSDNDGSDGGGCSGINGGGGGRCGGDGSGGGGNNNSNSDDGGGSGSGDKDNNIGNVEAAATMTEATAVTMLMAMFVSIERIAEMIVWGGETCSTWVGFNNIWQMLASF